MSELLLFNKPFGVISQFRESPHGDTLEKFIDVPDVYPAGRLDKDSEGLLLLTGDGALQTRIAHPSAKMAKTYWVQVEGTPTIDQLSTLRTGVDLKWGRTRPAQVREIPPPGLPARVPPVRHRKNQPTHWLAITLSEGKNRQIRQMTASVELPTLRLFRTSIGPWSTDGLLPGQWSSICVNLPKQRR
ncbi:MAG: pseudouridine synthase [Gammaproteobacteria bacterium]|uniref:Pseudouridine synthase n=1 Tax=OM182 bacterium MED-G24 TaxID=1986255 RepID=A0A2A5WTN9_9GAMM|nr:pseudouridine synthase [Gammaproteobacteria bacterium]PDH39849.1 MAG: pseudouridine synthase [OM182 bacterium MED-G24]RPG25610.1 MAG: pseudouridine synthase [Gammaproteobacteria bacterium TMED50]